MLSVREGVYPGTFFCRNSRLPARMISDSLEVEKQSENETMKSVHARFEPGALKSLWKYSLSRPLDFTPRVRREQNISTYASVRVSVP